MQVTKANPTLAAESKVRVTDAILNDDGQNTVLMVTGLEHVAAGQAAEAAEAAVLVKQEMIADPAPAHEVKTPASQTRRPEAAIKTPLSAAQPISSLNPYLHCWTIKAKVIGKGPKREFGKNKPNATGQSNSVFSAELVDEEGTAIEATFWRDAADRFHDTLEENKVYTFSRGSVKVANKNYNRTRNDYCLHFDASSTVEESADVIDASSMQTRMKFEKIDQLPAFVDKKAPVDVIGVVTAVGAPGSIKRKSDSQEVVRRDITMADDSLKTVTLTLWGEKAEQDGEMLNTMLQAGQTPVLAVSACRVGSYNGVTLSTSMRSNVMIDPEMSEALELKTWYEMSGATSTMSAVGEGLAAAKAAGAAKRRYFDLAEIQAKVPESEDAKPFYATVNAVVASINPDQKMYYLACPENNRKVVEQGPSEFYCEYDGKTYPTAVRRYVANARVMDQSGMISASFFDQQAADVFGKTADRMHELREEAADQYKSALAKATWQEWSFRIKAFASMWEGNLRKKYAVIDAKPVNFVAETRRVLAALNDM
jgi:replication factor A1